MNSVRYTLSPRLTDATVIETEECVWNCIPMISPRLLMSVAMTPDAVGSAGGNAATMWRLGTQTSYSNGPLRS